MQVNLRPVGSYAFNYVVASPESRWIFIQNAIDYLRKWKFDGIDLDWEYPGLSERGTTEETREQFNDLVKVKLSQDFFFQH